MQPHDARFGCVYVVDGGAFAPLALAQGRRIDGVRLDRSDVLGGMIALIGAGVIMDAPRS